MTTLETDYLVIGAGAVAMAFVDTLLSEDPAATVLMVDRRPHPGGHWNDAYSFVRLHQPSQWYGVASRELGRGRKDETGINAGLFELASGAEVLAYFDEVMQQRFLPSGRVQWLPMSEYGTAGDGSHRVTSLSGDEARTVVVRRKVVDATHARTTVPSTHAPRYAMADGVRCVPLNALPRIDRSCSAYAVIGSGKTGMDAVLWLLDNGVPSSRIRWVMPRDAWLINRANVQPGLENFERSMGTQRDQLQAILDASSAADLFARLESQALLMRIERSVQPTTYRCATVSPGELAQLRSIEDVVRLGRVARIERDRIVLAKGSVVADTDTLYVDCSATAIVHPPADLRVFDGERINLAMVRTCQPLFSAALIAYVECHFLEAEKNAPCAVVPSPEHPVDWLRMWLVSIVNMGRCRQHAGLSEWLTRCRLNAAAVYMRDVAPDDVERIALARSAGAAAGAAAARLPSLIAEMVRQTELA